MITVDKRFFANLIGYLQKAFQNKQGTAVEKIEIIYQPFYY